MKFFLAPDKKMSHKNDGESRKRVKINMVSFPIKKNKLHAHKGYKNDIFKKGRNRTESKKSGNHENRVEKQRRVKEVLKECGRAQIENAENQDGEEEVKITVPNIA